MDVRPLSPELAAPLEAFFRRVPESDHNSFAEDVLSPGVVQSWLADTRPRRAVAVAGEGEDERVVGYVAVLPLHGWSAHVGSLRVVVDPDSRGQGVGRALARYGLMTGLELGLSKIVVEVVVDAVPAIGMFEALGFEPEALLRDHVRDKTGELHDLVVLAHLVEGTWSGMATVGLEDALA
jgi:ribosomal protein S18 acetylase RimI-like enzyme